MERYKADIEAQTSAGFNALHIAAYHGQLKAVEVLVGFGADIEKRDDSMHTALFMASWQNHAEVVKWLLDRDANREAATSWGFTSLLVASRNGFVEPMNILIEAQAEIEHHDENGYTSVALAAKHGKVAALQLLIDRGAKIDSQDHFGNTALMLAIQESLTDELMETVQLLLKHDADVYHKKKTGRTPLMKAARLFDMDAASIVLTLIENGAIVAAKDAEGRTALMHSFTGGSQKAREHVLNNSGAILEEKDNLADTALIIASGYSDPTAVASLLDHGADISARDHFGLTPLMKAAKCGSEETIHLLLDRGAPIDALDNDNKTAIDHAATRERGNIIKLLKARGAAGRHNLTVINRAAVTLSNVMSWTLEACGEWERDWEITKLGELGTIEGEDASSVAAKKPDFDSDMMHRLETGVDESHVQMITTTEEQEPARSNRWTAPDGTDSSGPGTAFTVPEIALQDEETEVDREMESQSVIESVTESIDRASVRRSRAQSVM